MVPTKQASATDPSWFLCRTLGTEVRCSGQQLHRSMIQVPVTSLCAQHSSVARGLAVAGGPSSTNDSSIDRLTAAPARLRRTHWASSQPRIPVYLGYPARFGWGVRAGQLRQTLQTLCCLTYTHVLYIIISYAICIPAPIFSQLQTDRRDCQLAPPAPGIISIIHRLFCLPRATWILSSWRLQRP